MRRHVVQFRHPVCQDESGYGKVICRGVIKFPKELRVRIQAEVAQLVENAPARWQDVPLELQICEQSFDIYFQPLLGDKWRAAWANYRNRVSHLVRHEATHNPVALQLEDAQARIAELESQLATAMELLAEKMNKSKK